MQFLINKTKKLSIRSAKVLLVLGVVSITVLTIVEHSITLQRQVYYEEKLKASLLNHHFQNYIIESFGKSDGDSDIEVNERLSLALLGTGKLSNKLITINPNFSAMIVDQFKRAGIERGDVVVLCCSNSYPALNLATCAAIESLELTPILITLETKPKDKERKSRRIWYAMQESLYKQGLISFQSESIVVSEYQNACSTSYVEGIEYQLNNEDKKRFGLFNMSRLNESIKCASVHLNQVKNIKLFINIGGGVVSLGSYKNASKLPSGLHLRLKPGKFKDKQGVLFEMAEKKIPVLNLFNVQELVYKYDLPKDALPLCKAGEGTLFQEYKYNMVIVVITTTIFMVFIITVLYHDKKQNTLGTKIIKSNK